MVAVVVIAGSPCQLGCRQKNTVKGCWGSEPTRLPRSPAPSLRLPSMGGPQGRPTVAGLVNGPLRERNVSPYEGRCSHACGSVMTAGVGAALRAVGLFAFSDLTVGVDEERPRALRPKEQGPRRVGLSGAAAGGGGERMLRRRSG